MLGLQVLISPAAWFVPCEALLAALRHSGACLFGGTSGWATYLSSRIVLGSLTEPLACQVQHYIYIYIYNNGLTWFYNVILRVKTSPPAGSTPPWDVSGTCVVLLAGG